MGHLGKEKRSPEFVRFGKFDTLEHARNGLDFTYDIKNAEDLAKARLDLYNAHQKAKEILNGKNNAGKARKKSS